METLEKDETKKNFRERFLLPFSIPVVATLVVALLGISFSRIFLAGVGEHSGDKSPGSGATTPVMWATIITLVVLIGAALISAARMKNYSFNLIVVLSLLTIISIGAVMYSSGELGEETLQFGQPTPEEQASADPENAVAIQALPTNLFDSDQYSAEAGVVTFDYIGRGGAHTLRFKDARLNWFELVVNDTSTAQGQVSLEAGEYVVFCSIPGHDRMIANLSVQ